MVRRFAVVNEPTEWGFVSTAAYEDPFNDVDLDVLFTGEGGDSWRVPAFWAGGREWRIRFAPPAPGDYRFESVCTDSANADLHGVSGALTASLYDGDNPLLSHGPLRVAPGASHFEHADGTPFFWLGDTWWMGLCNRFSWPADFQELTVNRVRKGFNVIQIVAGLYPDMPGFDPRGANEAGYPWEAEYARISPAYFDAADPRIRWLVRSGLVPCIVGAWGYYLPWLGVDRMKRHWRYLVARYGAYPVVWCLAGEGTMPYYLSETPERDEVFQKEGWTEIGRYVRELDPYRRPITIHPRASGRDSVSDDSVLDFDMLQTGHSDRRSLPNTVQRAIAGRERQPAMPVVNAEVCYEGIGEACRQEVQRLVFWASVLSGVCGFTYGANGIWQVNSAEHPYGPSPHGVSWGHTSWREAAQLPGSTHLGLARRLLERYEWQRFEPHPEWVAPRWTEQDYLLPYAAGIPGSVRIIYSPLAWDMPVMKQIEPGVAYRCHLFNPTNAEEHDLGAVEPDANGDGILPCPHVPIYQDWLIVLEAPGARQH